MTCEFIYPTGKATANFLFYHSHMWSILSTFKVNIENDQVFVYFVPDTSFVRSSP